MAYADMAALAADPEWVRRLGACTVEQADQHLTDADTSSAALARAAIASTAGAGAYFAFPVAAEPGNADLYATGGQEAISDGIILSGVQAQWPIVAGAVFPEPAA